MPIFEQLHLKIQSNARSSDCIGLPVNWETTKKKKKKKKKPEKKRWAKKRNKRKKQKQKQKENKP